MIGTLSYLVFFMIMALIFAVAVMGLNLQWGYTGLFNAGVVGFFAIGAYAMAVLTGPARPELIGGFGLPIVVGLVGAMLAAGLAAIIVGLATLRLREDYLAIATFGIAVVIQLVGQNFESLTGGSVGLIGLPKPLASWFETPFGYNSFYLGLMVVVVIVTYVALERIVRSPWGRVLKAIRDDEIATAALGKNVVGFRLQAFILGCMIMGLSGALYVGFIGFVSALDFLPIVTFQIWTMLIVGGSGNSRGAILGSVVVWGIWTASGSMVASLVPPDLQARGAAAQVILIGLLLVITLLFRPRGLIGEEPHVSRHARL